MRFRLAKAALVSLAGIGLSNVASAEWSKSHVIDWYEPAMYFGGGTNFQAPGTDCLKGTNPEIDWVKVLVKAGYSEAEAKWLRSPENPSRSPVHGQNQMAFRGKHRENVYIHPESYPDPGLLEVNGEIAEGFDLDQDVTTGFRGPDGQRGIDNNYYRVMGCTKGERGPSRRSMSAISTNDTMRNGEWTIVMVLHGAGDDPMNDPNVDVAFYMSADKLVKDGKGNVASDYTFRIKPSKLESIVKVASVNGVVTSKGIESEIWMRAPGFERDLQLLRPQIKLEMKPDGTLSGYVGGYRPWRSIYMSLVNLRGPVIEVLGWYELPGIYYSLERHADFSPAGAKGEKTHISFAMRINAINAYVTTPDGASVRSQHSGSCPSDIVGEDTVEGDPVGAREDSRERRRFSF